LKQLEQTKQEGLEREPRKVIEGYRKEKKLPDVLSRKNLMNIRNPLDNLRI